MNDQDDNLNLIPAIEQDEIWFEGVMGRFPEPPCRCLGHIKEQIRVSADMGLGLDAADGPAVSPQVLARIKRAVRVELSQVDSGPRRAGRARWWGHRQAVLGTLAVAAVVAFLVLPFGSGPNGPTASPVSDGGYVLRDADLEWLFPNDGGLTDERLAGIVESLDEIEVQLASPLLSGSDRNDWEVEDLEEEIDRLLYEAELVDEI